MKKRKRYFFEEKLLQNKQKFFDMKKASINMKIYFFINRRNFFKRENRHKAWTVESIANTTQKF